MRLGGLATVAKESTAGDGRNAPATNGVGWEGDVLGSAGRNGRNRESAPARGPELANRSMVAVPVAPSTLLRMTTLASPLGTVPPRTASW